jgi:pyridoxal phosphate enzyme (YggS family)
MDFPGLPGRLAQVQETTARHQAIGGWTHPVKIVAVTKTHGPEAVRAAAAAGLRHIGENRVQEALQKQDALDDLPVEWHLIGTLQRNKARHAIGRFGLIHSVDRIDLALELDRRAAPGTIQRVLIQVNCSEEPQKGGVAPAELLYLLESMKDLQRLNLCGLMTMSALTDNVAEQRRAFRRLRDLRDSAEREGYRLPELSMGMSGDFPVAAEEGATMLRLGTVLFGERVA